MSVDIGSSDPKLVALRHAAQGFLADIDVEEGRRENSTSRVLCDLAEKILDPTIQLREEQARYSAKHRINGRLAEAQPADGLKDSIRPQVLTALLPPEWSVNSVSFYNFNKNSTSAKYVGVFRDAMAEIVKLVTQKHICREVSLAAETALVEPDVDDVVNSSQILKVKIVHLHDEASMRLRTALGGAPAPEVSNAPEDNQIQVEQINTPIKRNCSSSVQNNDVTVFIPEPANQILRNDAFPREQPEIGSQPGYNGHKWYTELQGLQNKKGTVLGRALSETIKPVIKQIYDAVRKISPSLTLVISHIYVHDAIGTNNDAAGRCWADLERWRRENNMTFQYDVTTYSCGQHLLGSLDGDIMLETGEKKADQVKERSENKKGT